MNICKGTPTPSVSGSGSGQCWSMVSLCVGIPLNFDPISQIMLYNLEKTLIFWNLKTTITEDLV